MRKQSVGRVLGALCLAGSFVFAATAPASAATPRWSMSVVDLPSLVANGSGAGYQVTISNAGPSNISSLFLVTKISDSPAFLTTTQGSCSAVGVGPLRCDFGALGAGASVTVVVGYVTPAKGASFDPVFQANSNGATFSDTKGRSHGDTLQDPGETATQLTASTDFAGGFALTDGTVSTGSSLSKNNPQSTSVTPPTFGVIVTAQDGLGANAFTCSGCTKTLFGDWSRVTVSHGETVGLFPVTLMVYGKALPRTATVDTIDLVHVLDNNAGTEILSTRCGSTPTLNCVTVTPVGSNYQITGWVDQNGGFKGMG